MNRFRIRANMCGGVLQFALEERVGLFWTERASKLYMPKYETGYSNWANEAIAYLRERHADFLKSRGAKNDHLKTPIIYLEDRL